MHESRPHFCVFLFSSPHSTRPSLAYIFYNTMRIIYRSWISCTAIILYSCKAITAFNNPNTVVSKQKLGLRYPLFLTTDNTDGDNNLIMVKDTPSIVQIFKQMCDENTQRMNKKQFLSIPVIADMMKNQDLSQQELDELWNTSLEDPSSLSSIPLESFVQLYRTIDNLFEDESTDRSNDAGLPLEKTFQELCRGSVEASIPRSALYAWNEIQDLLQENLLSQEELDQLWIQASTSPKNVDAQPPNRLNYQGFLYFNTLLDELFVSDDDNEEEKEKEKEETQKSSSFVVEPTPVYMKDVIVSSGNNPSSPQTLFTKIAQGKPLIPFDVIYKQWGDLGDMIRDGDVSIEEAKGLFRQAAQSHGTGDLVNQDGFISFYQAIDDLFEEDMDEIQDGQVQTTQSPSISSKTLLLALLTDLEKDTETLPCGLECTEEQIQLFSKVVKDLERESTNLLISKRSNIKPSDIAGKWKLVYTSSSTLKFNKGISGLVPPTGKFGGLIQNLKATKFMLDLEYIETVNAGPGSFDVRVTGDWELKSSVSLFTGEQAMLLKVEPNLVQYGITSQKADHWKSLGPMNLLDISYMDNDMRIMRGTTSSESIFIFKRTA